MARHSSARLREGLILRERDAETGGHGDAETEHSSHKSHSIEASLKSNVIDASLKRRARLLITNGSIPKHTRSLIRYALETKDPRLAQWVWRVEARELTIECLYLE